MQTKTTHTPGPWFNNGGQIEAEHPLTGKRWKVVATVGEVNEQAWIDTANAQLIAASPLLLEALEATIAPLRAYHASNIDELVAHARTAIAQARGEAT